MQNNLDFFSALLEFFLYVPLFLDYVWGQSRKFSGLSGTIHLIFMNQNSNLASEVQFLISLTIFPLLLGLVRLRGPRGVGRLILDDALAGIPQPGLLPNAVCLPMLPLIFCFWRFIPSGSKTLPCLTCGPFHDGYSDPQNVGSLPHHR